MNGLDNGDMAPNEPTLRAFAPACRDLRTAVEHWRELNTRDLASFNALLSRAGIAPVPAAAPPLPTPSCPALPTTAAGGGRGRGRGR